MRRKRLKKREEMELNVVKPFNFEHTFYKPSHFPTGLEIMDDGKFYRTFNTGNKLVGLKVTELPRERGVFVEVYANKSLSERDAERTELRIRRGYGLDEDIKPFYDSVKEDEKLKPVIKRMYGMRNNCFESLFEILNISCVLQNATVKRSEQMLSALLEKFGHLVHYDGKELKVFYSPEDIADSTERELKLLRVGYRAKYIISIATHFSGNPEIEERIRDMDFDKARGELTKIRGIGPYSADLALFSYLRYPNAINFDVWNTKILSNFLFSRDDVPLNRLRKVCKDRWGEYSGYAALYIIEDLFASNPQLQYWRRE